MKAPDVAFGMVANSDYESVKRRLDWYTKRYDEALTLLARARSAMSVCSNTHGSVREQIFQFMERERKGAQ